MKTIKKLSTAAVVLSLLAGRVFAADESVMRGEYHKEIKAKKVVAGDLYVQDHAKFFGCAHVDKDLEVDGKLDVDHCADFGKDVEIHGSLKVHDKLHVHRDAEFCHDVRIDDDLCVGDDVVVGDDLKVCGDFFLKGRIKTRCDVHDSVKKLHEAYRAFDAEFNEKCCANFDFCYYDDKSTVLVHGPFTPDVCGHLGHILQPGSAQAFGKSESDQLESHLLGAFLRDPYFPYCVCECAPKVVHHCPVVTAVINNELVNIATQIDVHYPGLNGPVVATIHGIGQYRLECCPKEDHQEPPTWVQDPNTPQQPDPKPNGDHHKPKKECKECHPDKEAKCPKVVWVHWNVSYNDCSLTCPPCFGVTTTTQPA